MKYLSLLFMLIIFNNNIESQNEFPPERIVVIANIENGKSKTADYSLSDLRIESKIARAFKIDLPNLKLVNPTITDEGGKGWFIQYEFDSQGYIGLWKEQLQLRNGQLVITESRSAKIGVATNCEKIQFTNDVERCKCAKKKDVALESEVTLRLFSSTN